MRICIWTCGTYIGIISNVCNLLRFTVICHPSFPLYLYLFFLRFLIFRIIQSRRNSQNLNTQTRTRTHTLYSAIAINNNKIIVQIIMQDDTLAHPLNERKNVVWSRRDGEGGRSIIIGRANVYICTRYIASHE